MNSVHGGDNKLIKLAKNVNKPLSASETRIDDFERRTLLKASPVLGDIKFFVRVWALQNHMKMFSPQIFIFYHITKKKKHRQTRFVAGT